MQTVGLAIIAKNEESNLPNLLESVAGAFDQVVLLDTGSKDDTKGVFTRWALKEREGKEHFDTPHIEGGVAPFYKVRDFKWCDDFAAARIAADSYLDTDWFVWADCDDVITGAENIRQMINQAPPELGAYICGYNYAQIPNGECVCYLKRERVVRRGAGHWAGRVHEAQSVDGAAQFVPPHALEWVHRKGEIEEAKNSNTRNLRILRKWVKDEPTNTRIIAYLGTEHAVRGRHREAIGYYKRYLKLNPEWHEEQAQVCRKLSGSLMALERIDEAEQYAYRALRVLPSWPDSYLTLAEICLDRKEYQNAIYWADRAAELGHPDTLLIVNPLDYSYRPIMLKAFALAHMQHVDDAILMAEKGLSIFADDNLRREMMGWKTVSKREHTAHTYILCARQLITHEEPLKARQLLEECVPYFIQDHAQIVGLRSLVREQLMHSGRLQAKQEEYVADEGIDILGDHLPRTQFLLAGVLEQVA